MPALPAPSFQRGFTLIEAMVVVSVLAALLMVAAPSMKGIIITQRVRAAAFDLVADLVLARSEALKRGASVVVVPSASGWVGGWSVQVGASSEVLNRRNPVGGGVSFLVSPTSITFDGSGRVSAASTVRLGLSGGTQTNRCISLDPAGRPKSAVTTCPP